MLSITTLIEVIERFGILLKGNINFILTLVK